MLMWCWILFLADAINMKCLGICPCYPETPQSGQRGFAGERTAQVSVRMNPVEIQTSGLSVPE